MCVILFEMQRRWEKINKKYPTLTDFVWLEFYMGFAFKTFLHGIKKCIPLRLKKWGREKERERERNRRKISMHMNRCNSHLTKKNFTNCIGCFSHRLFDFANDAVIEFQIYIYLFFFIDKSNMLQFIDLIKNETYHFAFR